MIGEASFVCNKSLLITLGNASSSIALWTKLPPLSRRILVCTPLYGQLREGELREESWGSGELCGGVSFEWGKVVRIRVFNPNLRAPWWGELYNVSSTPAKSICNWLECMRGFPWGPEGLVMTRGWRWSKWCFWLVQEISNHWIWTKLDWVGLQWHRLGINWFK